MKKYDVLILCQYFYPEYNTSAVLPYEMAEDLVKKGLKVKVVCGYPKEYLKDAKVSKKEKAQGIHIHRLNYLQLCRKSKIGRLINYFSFLASVILNWYLLLDNKCTLVYSNPPILPLVTAINKRLFKIKYMFVSYDIYPDVALVTHQIKEGSLIHQLMNVINRLMDQTVDQVIALSEDMKSYLIKTRPTLDENKITVIPNWFNEGNMSISQEIIYQEFRELRDKYKVIVLYSGNMGICQDVDVILDAAIQLKENQDVLFVFTGHGQKKDALEARANEHHLNHVKFFGFLSGQTYIDMLRLADCHVISLESGMEGTCVPSKTYSYMAMGRPLIAIMGSHTDIAKDIEENKLGAVVEPGHVKELVEYLNYLLNHPEEIKEMGSRVKAVYLDKYTREQGTTKYFNIICEVLETKGINNAQKSLKLRSQNR